ncbi:MAG: tetratricopeptide repeat protein [Spartobacteria bacterium]
MVRFPGLQGEMVWDDSFLIRENPFIKSPLLIFEAFRHYLFLDSFSAHYRPVQNLSFMVDYFFWNGNTYGFHLTNVLLHLGSGLLLYRLLEELFASLRRAHVTMVKDHTSSAAAFFVSLVWIVHPVHSAAIDYISGRADSLAFLFACAGWLLFLRGRHSSRLPAQIVCYALAAFSGLLALCSREIALVWFAIFFLHLLVFERSTSRRALIITIACSLTVIAIYGGLRALPGERAAVAPTHGWPAPMRATLMGRALGDYTRLMLFPSNLHMERTVVEPRNYLSLKEWSQSAGTEYLSVLGLFACAALAYGCARAGIGQRTRVFGASWFVLGFLPISNLIELNATVAEHWLYLPSAGLLIFLAGCALDLSVNHRRLSIACVCCAVAALSIRSAVRSSDWATEEIFYQRTLAAGGQSTRILGNLGQVYANRGEYAKAEAIFRDVLRITPDYPMARNNLAEVLVRQGRKQEAEAILASTTRATETTRKEYPRTWIAVLNLALSHRRDKDDAGALAIAEKARRDYPGIWEIISFESEVLRETKGPAAAIPLLKAYAEHNWWHYAAYLAMGRLYAEKGEIAQAEAALRHASWLDLHDAAALSLMAQICVRTNRLDEAYAAQTRAVARQPDEPRQYTLLSHILEKLGRPAEAQIARTKVSQLRTLAVAQTP